MDADAVDLDQHPEPPGVHLLAARGHAAHVPDARRGHQPHRVAVDVHPVTLVSSATVEHLRSVTPGGEQLDSRRFRMLVEVDGVGVHEEDSWVGRRVRLGGATIRVVGPVPRCVVTNENPETGEVDFNTLKSIVRYRGELETQLSTPVAHLPDSGKVVFGLYATVEEPGEMALGDDVTPLDD